MQEDKHIQAVAPGQTRPEQWLEEYGDYLYRFARWRLRDDVLAEDAVQETLLSAFQACSRFDGRSSEKTWLTGILKNKIYDIFRKQLREVVINDTVETSDTLQSPEWTSLFDQRGNWLSAPQDWGNPYLNCKNEQFLMVFEHCFERLPPAFSHVFLLKVLMGRSTREICNELEITASNVNVILCRARLKLRNCIETNWPTDSKD